MPDWVGVIDPPRGRNYGTITVTAYTAEYIWKLRCTQNPVELSGSVAYFYTALVDYANQQGGTQIAKGVINYGDTGHVNSIGCVNIFDEISRLSDNYGCDYDITPTLSATNNLQLAANWYARKGSIRTDYEIDETNSELVETNGIEEQSPFYNHVQGVGNATTWDTKVRYTAMDTSSMTLYGPHQSVVNVDGNDQTTVQNYANAKLYGYLTPPKTFSVTVDNRSSLWGKIRLGDTVTARYTWGRFYGEGAMTNMIRIVGMSVNEMAGKMALVAQEVR
jgi:hypothetical protein